jgi:hypothetical protein
MDSVTVYSPAVEWCINDNGSVSEAQSIGSCPGAKFVKNDETMYIPIGVLP